MDLSEFAARFSMDRAEIVAREEHVARPGEYSDFFYSYCFLNGELYSLNVSYPVVPYYRLHTPEFHQEREQHRERLYLNRYAANGQGYERVERIELGGGEDPRVVSDGKQAYAVIIAANPLYEHEMQLYDLVERRMVPITVADSDFEYGKNWQPFLRDGALYCVHQLTPFRVLEIDTETGAATVVQEIDVDFNMPCTLSQFGSNFTVFRGGSNAITDDGALLGLGRATPISFRHAPFFWRQVGEHVDFSFTSFFSDFYDQGYNIIDPTSLFVEGDDLYLGLCCTERDWAHTQLVTNLLLVFRGDGGGGEALADFFARRPSTRIEGRPNLDRHLFFCADMPCGEGSRIEFSGRASSGQAGHVVFGPYLRIEKAGRYCAELSYLTKSSSAGRAGVFDVVSSVPHEDFVELGARELEPTEGHTKHARIEFDTKDAVGSYLETRVYVDEGVELVAFHIRTWLSENGEDWPSVWQR